MRFPANGPLLFVAPHTDDVELGCGGTISRALEEGAEVHVSAFSTAEESRPEGTPRTVLKDEFIAAMSTLHVPDSHLTVYEFPVRHLDSHRQQVLEGLVALRNSIDPSMVFAPASSDVHQDHQVVHAECLRAFKHLTLWGYELPWNHVSFDANAFVQLERRHIDAKWQALQKYETQFALGRPYFSLEFIESLARVRGTQAKAEYAESFEVVRVRM
jgi:N-acetylglucosamine malate deacetylase 1